MSLEPRMGYEVETVPLNSQGAESCWRWGLDKAREAIELDDPRGSQVVARRVRTGSWNVYEKHRPTTQKAKTIWDETEVRTEAGTREVRAMFGATVFDHPKPLALLKKLISISTTSASIVMDFFAGSGSTAHAVLELNREDGGQRQFISVQLDEGCDAGSTAAQQGFHTIADIGRERLRRAVRGFGERAEGVDTGFRSFRVDSTNMVDVLSAPDVLLQAELDLYQDSVKPDRSSEDLLFQVLLDSGLELSLPITRHTVHGVEVFSVDDDALIACFAATVTPEVVQEIAARGPLRAVFRDDAFESDAARINAEQVFRETSPATDVRTI